MQYLKWRLEVREERERERERERARGVAYIFCN